jgi:hypothetical protein
MADFRSSRAYAGSVRGSAIIGLVLLGCPGPTASIEAEPWPETIGAGDRVQIASATVDEVCAGTIVALDDAIDRVEQQLELDRVDAPVDVYLLGPGLLAERCGPDVVSCSVAGEPAEIYVRAELYESRIAHELVHDRIAYTPAVGSAPLFDEGIAAALAPPWCPPLPSWVPPDAGEWLDAADAGELPEHGEYLGGELVRWLLDVHGPEAVLEFMATLGSLRDAASIRSAYVDRFGADLDTELFAHLRGLDEPLDPAEAGCLAPDVPTSASFLGYELDATLDCDSPRVHNDFARPERLYVEWTLHVDPAEGGDFQLLDELPEGSELRFTPCACRLGEGTNWSSLKEVVFDDATTEWEAQLDPGVYRVRWSGPPGATLELDIVAPCDFVEQNCPGGLACDPSNECVVPPSNPQLEGEPCSVEADFSTLQGNCDVGLYCLGDMIGDGLDDGVCMAYCGDGSLGVVCPDGLSCGILGVCAVDCDPLLQDCEPGWGCFPGFPSDGPFSGFSSGVGTCLPAGELGLLDPCGVFDIGSCAPGLVCESSEEVENCSDGWFSGCCRPLCDPEAADPGCPAELPNCDADDGDVIGVCGS